MAAQVMEFFGSVLDRNLMVEHKHAEDISRIVNDAYIRYVTLRIDVRGDSFDGDIAQSKRDRISELYEFDGKPPLPWDVGTVALQRCLEDVKWENARG